MADNESLLSPTYKFRKSSSSSSIFSSPRLFTGFTLKDCTDTESIRSPTSVFDSKPFSAVKAPLCSDNSNSPRTSKPESRIHLDKIYSKGVGLGLVDALIDETSDPILSKTKSRMVLFGSQLKIQIPQLLVSVISSTSDYRKSPEDFGIKPQNYQPVLSPNSSNISPFGSLNSGLEISNSPRTSSLSAGEMELLEEYTCVITHGPNPKTIHIFDDCIIESCCGIVGSSTSSKKDNGFGTDKSFHYPSESFLSSCYNCKKNLGEGKDIYMYRGEKAFCSSECRCKEIISDDGIQKSDDTYQA